jgi:hypothetical protein
MSPLRALLSVSCLVPVLLPAAPSHAQTGSRMGAAPASVHADPNSPDGIRQLVYDYANCVINRDRKRVDAYLASPPDSAESDRLWPTVAQDECLTVGTLTLTDAGFRGGAYNRLYRSDFGKKGPQDFSAVAPIDYAAGMDAGRPEARTDIGSRQLADCMVRADSADAKALVLSRIASSDETKALERLQPPQQACAQKTVQITFSKAALRAVIGEVLYRLSKAVPAETGSGKLK